MLTEDIFYIRKQKTTSNETEDFMCAAVIVIFKSV
jgi:hypothetical protein